MTKSKKEPDFPMYNCEVCRKLIPESAAMTAEGVDYVLYYCGIECYETWQKQDEKEQSKPPSQDG